MGFKRGDRVKFLNDTGGGIIAGIRDEKTVMVMTADGFEVPVPVKELIATGQQEGSGVYREKDEDLPGVQKDKLSLGIPTKDSTEDATGLHESGMPGSGTATWFSSGADTGINTAGEVEGKLSSGIDAQNAVQTAAERNLLIALVETGTPDKLEAWLINDSSFNVLYNFMIRQDEFYRTIKAGMLEGDNMIFVADFSRDQINAFVSFRLQAVFFLRGNFNPVSPAQREFTVDPSQVYSSGYISVNDFFEEKAAIIPVISDSHDREVKKISEQEADRMISEREKGAGTAVRKERKSDPLVEEVDLHIEELVDDHAGLSGREVLDIQLARFATTLEGAIRGKTRRIVFIHGVGNGKLKFEIRKTLDRKYPRLRYQDASFREYGYGATMVIIGK